GRESWTRCDHAHQIERVGGADRNHRFVRRGATNRSEKLHGFCRGKLLTGKSAHKTSAAKLSARFQTPVNSQQIAPRHVDRFAFEHLAKDDSVTREQLVR